MPESDLQALLRAGITAAKAGQREQARQTLLRVIEQDEASIPAWLWLSTVLDDQEERRICLENVLTLDPDNAHARAGLLRLDQASKEDRRPETGDYRPLLIFPPKRLRLNQNHPQTRPFALAIILVYNPDPQPPTPNPRPLQPWPPEMAVLSVANPSPLRPSSALIVSFPWS